MFRKSRNKPEPVSSGEDRIDALASRLHEEGKLDELESELSKYDPESLEDPERESWYHLYGIEAFHRGDRALAFERFQEGIRQCPGSAIMNFSLGQEHEFRGEAQNMFECFDKALFPVVSANHSLAEARYAYLWGRNDKGWLYVEPLMPVYFDLKILDDHFLYVRGLPFFQQTWAYLAAFSQLEEDFTRLDEITRKAEATCSDLDFDGLDAYLAAFQTGDFSAVKKRLRTVADEPRPNGFPHGYQDLELHILLAQESESATEALRLLDSVEFASNDFRWLEDMRLLAKCEQAYKANDLELERELRLQFIGRQPMLFEPDNAINFNLLRYQERLKRDYQKSRQGNG